MISVQYESLDFRKSSSDQLHFRICHGFCICHLSSNVCYAYVIYILEVCGYTILGIMSIETNIFDILYAIYTFYGTGNVWIRA